MIRLAAFALVAVVSLGGKPGFTQAADPEAEAQFEEVVLMLREQRFEPAFAVIADLLRSGSLSDDDLARALRYKGTAYLLSGQHGEALAALSSALDVRSRDPWLLWRRCEVNSLIGFLASARRDCRDAREVLDSRWAASLDPSRAEYLAFSISLTEADLYRKLGAHERAVSLLRMMEVSENLASVDWRRHEKLATLLFDTDNFDGAVTHLDTAIEGSTQAPNVNRAFLHFVRAVSFSRLERADAAAEDFVQAVTLDQDNELYLFRACDFALKTKNRTLADKACSALVSLYPEKSLYQRAAAINEALSGRFADALSRFGGAVVEGRADLKLMEAILEAAAYSTSCIDGTDAPECVKVTSD